MRDWHALFDIRAAAAREAQKSEDDSSEDDSTEDDNMDDADGMEEDSLPVDHCPFLCPNCEENYVTGGTCHGCWFGTYDNESDQWGNSEHSGACRECYYGYVTGGRCDMYPNGHDLSEDEE